MAGHRRRRAVFAAFPLVYAMTFSGFYLAIMLVLFGLILRAVSLEFRHRDPSWRAVWDGAFFLGSLAAVPARRRARSATSSAACRSTRTVTTPAPSSSCSTRTRLLVGVTGLALIITHGAAWLLVQDRGRSGSRPSPLARASPSGCAWSSRWRRPRRPSRSSRAPRTTCSAGPSAGWLPRPVGGVVALHDLADAEQGGEVRRLPRLGRDDHRPRRHRRRGNYPEMVPARGTPPETSLTVTSAASGRATPPGHAHHRRIGCPIVSGSTPPGVPHVPRQGETGGRGSTEPGQPVASRQIVSRRGRRAIRPAARFLPNMHTEMNTSAHLLDTRPQGTECRSVHTSVGHVGDQGGSPCQTNCPRLRRSENWTKTPKTCTGWATPRSSTAA